MQIFQLMFKQCILKILFPLVCLLFLISSCREENPSPSKSKNSPNFPVINNPPEDTTGGKNEVSNELRFSIVFEDLQGKKIETPGNAEINLYGPNEFIIFKSYHFDVKESFMVNNLPPGGYIAEVKRDGFTSKGFKFRMSEKSIVGFEDYLRQETGAYIDSLKVSSASVITFSYTLVAPKPGEHLVQIFVSDDMNVSKDNYKGVITNRQADGSAVISKGYYAFDSLPSGTKVYAVAYVSNGYENIIDFDGREKCFKIFPKPSNVVSFVIQ